MHITAFVTPVVEHWLEREIATSRSRFGQQGLKLKTLVPKVTQKQNRNSVPHIIILYLG